MTRFTIIGEDGTRSTYFTTFDPKLLPYTGDGLRYWEQHEEFYQDTGWESYEPWEIAKEDYEEAKEEYEAQTITA